MVPHLRERKAISKMGSCAMESLHFENGATHSSDMKKKTYLSQLHDYSCKAVL